MFTNNKFIISFLFVVIIFTTIACKKSTPVDNNLYDLSGKWKIIVSSGDEPTSPDYDDSKADEIVIPGNWNNIVFNNKDFTSTVWIRKTFTIADEISQRLFVFSPGSISVADETYVNGVYIGGSGRIPSEKTPLDYDLAWHIDRNYNFPSKLLIAKGKNVIAIKIFSHFFNGIKGHPQLKSYKKWKEENEYKKYIPEYINLGPLIVTIFPLFFFFIIVKGGFIKGSNKRKIVTYSIFIGIAVFLIVLHLLGFSKYSNGLNRFKLIFILYPLIDLLLVMIVQEIFSIKIKSILPVLIIPFFLVLIGIVAAPDTRFLVKYCGVAVVSIIISYIIYLVFIFISALFKDPQRYWYLVFVGIFLLISVSNSLYYQITLQMYKTSLSFIFRLPVIVFGAMFLYIFDMRNIQNEKDLLAKALLKKSQKLKKIMNDRESEKIVPRNIINDLIEYLENNYSETYDRKMLAVKFNLNENYMGQVFKKTTGTNIADFINSKRIEGAKELLKNSEIKIIDIAFHVGFDNLTYFNRYFKKQTGSTPTGYRKYLRRNLFDSDDLNIEDEAY